MTQYKLFIQVADGRWREVASYSTLQGALGMAWRLVAENPVAVATNLTTTLMHRGG